MRVLDFWYSCHHPTLNATVVRPTEYLEGATISPAQQSDGVTSQGFAGNVLINSRLVVGEVLEHREGGFSGPVSHQLHLDLLHISLDGVTLLPEGFVLLVRNVVARIVAPPVTFW